MKRFCSLRADQIRPGDEISLGHSKPFREVLQVCHETGRLKTNKVRITLRDGWEYFFHPERILVTMRREDI